jgi:hypothetical protein
MPYESQRDAARRWLDATIGVHRDNERTDEEVEALAKAFDEYEVKGMEVERKATLKLVRHMIEAYPAAGQALAMVSLDIENGRHLR